MVNWKDEKYSNLYSIYNGLDDIEDSNIIRAYNLLYDKGIDPIKEDEYYLYYISIYKRYYKTIDILNDETVNMSDNEIESVVNYLVYDLNKKKSDGYKEYSPKLFKTKLGLLTLVNKFNKKAVTLHNIIN